MFWHLWLLPCCVAEPEARSAIRLPHRPEEKIAIDGKISPQEWQGAHEIEIAGDAKALVFQTERDLLLAIRITTPSPAYVDVFLLLDDGKRINLHASMQVGERELPADGWDDREPPTHWGRQAQWRGNAVKKAPGKDESAPIDEMFLPYDGYEFRLAKARFGGRTLRMRIEVRDFAARRSDLVYPEASTRFDAASWAVLSLEP